ncbi:MAG: hypothetical protein K2K02_04220 [Ruminococcus sp.]|nr:hypothetical protein [Ruminococcus sp.]
MKTNSMMTLQEAFKVIAKTIHIGSKVEGYVVFGVWNNCCIAENPKAPEPYVVWTIDSNGFGVRAGKYFENFQKAQKCFYQEAIKSRPRGRM